MAFAGSLRIKVFYSLFLFLKYCILALTYVPFFPPFI
jgi:hypothetical protein